MKKILFVLGCLLLFFIAVYPAAASIVDCEEEADNTPCFDEVDDCYVAVCYSGECIQQHDVYSGSDHLCMGPSFGGPCDDDEYDHCSGNSGTCVDAFKSDGTECQDEDSSDCYNAVCIEGLCTQESSLYYEGSDHKCMGESRDGPCDADSLEYCSGSDATCPDVFVNPGTLCPDTVDNCYKAACDVNGFCDQGYTGSYEEEGVACSTEGGGPQCSTPGCDGNGYCDPSYNKKPYGASCGDPEPNGDCDNADICDGLGNCSNNYKAEGANCKGPDDGPGEVRDCYDAQCDGAGTCDYDHAYEAAGTPCGNPSNAACNAPDSCNAVGVCLNKLKPSGTTCRESMGPCDLADVCSGSSTICEDEKSTAECRPVSGVCDLPEFCDGEGDYCPSDTLKSAGTSCRDSTGECDPAEVCMGDVACPDDITYCVADGELLPIRTTCQNYVDGVTPVPMYDAFLYQVKGKPLAINSISQSVIFYYVTVKGSDLPVTINQWNTLGWKPMLMQQGKLYDAACNKLSSTTSTNTDPYSVTIGKIGLDPDATYYIGIMYTSDNLKGTLMPVRLSNEYFWQALNVGDRGDSILVIPKVV